MMMVNFRGHSRRILEVGVEVGEIIRGHDVIF